MTCPNCEKKPKCNCTRDFPRAVIEIDNPEAIALLRKVIIPASMGDETDVPAAVGKYHNVILHYEANKHNYLYSSDGIPTLLESEVPQEVWDSIEQLQQEIDEIKNNPDVVDIVDTYADLQAYDTSGLGDKDVIRVLNDETHDGKSAYYRWNKPNSQWVFIGAVDNYYTKEETDERIESVYGKSKILTSDDYNWNSVSKDTTEPFDSVALWLLDDGIYSVDDNTVAYIYKTLRADTASYIVAESASGSSYKAIYAFEVHFAYIDKNYGAALSRFTVSVSDGSLSNSELFASRTMVNALISDFIKSGNGAPSGAPIEGAGLLYEDKTNGKLYQFDGTNWVELNAIVDALNSTDTNKSLSANQGRVLKETIDDNKGLAKDLTSADYNWNSVSHDTTEPYDSVALWRLPPGTYICPSGVSGYVGYNPSSHVWYTASEKKLYQVSPQGTYAVMVFVWEKMVYSGGSDFTAGIIYGVIKDSQIVEGHFSGSCTIAAPIDNLNGISHTGLALSAKQGWVLNSKIGDMTTLTTNNQDSIVQAINEVNAEGDYSLTYEKNTENKWTDGSLIYKRTISVASLPNSGTQQFSTGITAGTLAQVVRLEVIAHDANNNIFVHIPDGEGATARMNGTGVEIKTTADYSGYSAYMTIWYTKNQ